jgi:hypothetical protein
MSVSTDQNKAATPTPSPRRAERPGAPSPAAPLLLDEAAAESTPLDPAEEAEAGAVEVEVEGVGEAEAILAPAPAGEEAEAEAVVEEDEGAALAEEAEEAAA